MAILGRRNTMGSINKVAKEKFRRKKKMYMEMPVEGVWTPSK